MSRAQTDATLAFEDRLEEYGASVRDLSENRGVNPEEDPDELDDLDDDDLEEDEIDVDDDDDETDGDELDPEFDSDEMSQDDVSPPRVPMGPR